MIKEDYMFISACCDNAEKMLKTIPDYKNLDDTSKNICRVIASCWLLKSFCEFCKHK